MKPWPKDWPVYRVGNQTCDMLVGPCCCGATHLEGEFKVINGALYRNARMVKLEHQGSKPLTIDLTMKCFLVEDLEKQIEGIKNQIAKLKLRKAIIEASSLEVVVSVRGAMNRERTIYFEKDTPGLIVLKQLVLETKCNAEETMNEQT